MWIYPLSTYVFMAWCLIEILQLWDMERGYSDALQITPACLSALLSLCAVRLSHEYQA
jgi:hypothetical protein